MKRHNWLLGIVLSVVISILGSFPRLLRAEAITSQIVTSTILYTLLFSLLSWFFHYYILNGVLLQYKIRHAELWGLAGVVLIALSAYPYDSLFVQVIAPPPQLTDMPNGKRIAIVFLRGFIISSFYYFVIYYMHVLAEKQKNSLELEQLKQAQLLANLSSLKEQLSPHFLFNTLNTITTLTQEKKVKDFVNELSNVYRYVLQYKENNLATLQQELTFIESYLYIIKTRLEDAININIQVQDSALQTEIPPLTLQMLIENAVKHNIAASYKPLTIAIYTTDEELVVENNLQPKTSVAASTGIGLSNIAERYRLLFNKEIVILQSADSFTVKLPVV